MRGLIAASVVLFLSATAARADYLYVCNANGTTIGKYTTSGGTVNASLIAGLTAPDDMVLDGKGEYLCREQLFTNDW